MEISRQRSRNGYIAEGFQIMKDIDSKFWYHKLETWIMIVSTFHVPIREILSEIEAVKERHGRAGSDLFVGLNESAIP